MISERSQYVSSKAAFRYFDLSEIAVLFFDRFFLIRKIKYIDNILKAELLNN